jgi:hypothetical protein
VIQIFLVDIGPLRGGVMPHMCNLRELQMNPSTLLGLKPLSTGVVDYSDVHQDQHQEVSNFLIESFNILGRVTSNTNHQSLRFTLASYALMLRGCDGPLASNFFIPHWDKLRYECFENVHKHPFACHFGAQRILEIGT